MRNINPAIKIKNVKTVVGEIRNCAAPFFRIYLNKETGALWCNVYASCNSWDQYDDAIEVMHGNTPSSIFQAPAPTMAEVREETARAIARYNFEVEEDNAHGAY